MVLNNSIAATCSRVSTHDPAVPSHIGTVSAAQWYRGFWRAECSVFGHPPRVSENIRRVFALVSVVGVIALVSPVAFGADPAEEMAKSGIFTTGGLDLSANAWTAIQTSLEEFLHPIIALRLFLNLAVAVACGCLIAWHPRSSRVESLEDKKTIIVLGVLGAVIAEVTGINQALAFVIFGIGSLLRFRTALNNPKLTGKAITVVVVGLACGLGSWAMAAFVTGFVWILLFWLDSRVGCRLRIRLASDVDLDVPFDKVQALLSSRGCRVHSSMINTAKRRLAFVMHIPTELDLTRLEKEIRATIPTASDARIDFNIV
jgi:hypothetical protein